MNDIKSRLENFDEAWMDPPGDEKDPAVTLKHAHAAIRELIGIALGLQAGLDAFRDSGPKTINQTRG